VFAVVLLICSAAAAAASAVAPFVVRTNLAPLIRAAAGSQAQFAVSVPHLASTAASGSWSVSGEEATWRYAVQVPTAVSLSFHALGSLPASATLLVEGGSVTTSYSARDLHRGELWSRVHAGDTLALTLSVAAADRGGVDFRIVGLQAGYRAIGPGVEDHPLYRQLTAQSSADDNSACVTNYECAVTPGNAAPAAATVALVVENLYQCTGTLLNDVPGDNTPYVLTARHCETGQLGGGKPTAAAGVMVYWNAVSACGTPLGSIYDGTLATQTGARTVVEQQDAWLIVLDSSPVVADAQLAGFDASGAAVVGGYTIHNAAGRDQQLVVWSGTAYSLEEQGALGTSYVSNFLETVNQQGNIGAGASGSALLNGDNHVVGALTLGRKTSDPSGYESCPVTPPPAPNGSNGVADFTALAAVWDSTADTTSSTGSTTLRAVLDPGNTGSRVVPSMPVEIVALGASPPPAPRITFNPANVAAGQSFSVSWSASNAASCTLSGGVPGGAWGTSAQSMPSSGATTESGPAGIYTFGLVCQGTEAATPPVSTQATLTIRADAAAAATGAATATAPEPQNNTGNTGGAGAMGILEGTILAALLAFTLLRRTPAGKRWRLPGQLSLVRRRIRPQERTPRS
jgi:lysyl endopeptidase